MFFLPRMGILASVLAVVNIVALLFFIATALNPYLDVHGWLGAGFLGILFPYALIGIVICVILDIFLRSRWVILLLVALAVAWKQVAATFAFSPLQKRFSAKIDSSPRTLRVLTWNVHRFQPMESNNMYAINLTTTHQDIFKTYRPDVLCLQEFMTQSPPITNKRFNVAGIFEREYPYHYYVKQYDLGNRFSFGNIIYSKHPIVRTGTITLTPVGNKRDLNDSTDTSYSGSLFADIVIRDTHDTIRIITSHMRSYGFKKYEYEEIRRIRETKDVNLEASKDLFNKIRAAFIGRKRQSDALVRAVTYSPHPIILTGDFNDVPVSHTYFSLRHILQDAFLDKGNGIGRTFTRLLPMLRIDFILHSAHFRTQQVGVLDGEHVSDHLPLIADLSLSPR